MRLPRGGGIWGTVLAHPSAILLIVQLIGVLVYPFMEETGPGTYRTSEPIPVVRQPPLKNVCQPLRSEKREKPQRW